MLVLKCLGGSFEEVFGRLITFSRFTKDFTRTVLGSPNNQMTPQTTPNHIDIYIIYRIYIVYILYIYYISFEGVRGSFLAICSLFADSPIAIWAIFGLQ